MNNLRDSRAFTIKIYTLLLLTNFSIAVFMTTKFADSGYGTIDDWGFIALMSLLMSVTLAPIVLIIAMMIGGIFVALFLLILSFTYRLALMFQDRNVRTLDPIEVKSQLLQNFKAAEHGFGERPLGVYYERKLDVNFELGFAYKGKTVSWLGLRQANVIRIDAELPQAPFIVLNSRLNSGSEWNVSDEGYSLSNLRISNDFGKLIEVRYARGSAQDALRYVDPSLMLTMLGDFPGTDILIHPTYIDFIVGGLTDDITPGAVLEKCVRFVNRLERSSRAKKISSLTSAQSMRRNRFKIAGLSMSKFFLIGIGGLFVMLTGAGLTAIFIPQGLDNTPVLSFIQLASVLIASAGGIIMCISLCIVVAHFMVLLFLESFFAIAIGYQELKARRDYRTLQPKYES